MNGQTFQSFTQAAQTVSSGGGLGRGIPWDKINAEKNASSNREKIIGRRIASPWGQTSLVNGLKKSQVPARLKYINDDGFHFFYALGPLCNE